MPLSPTHAAIDSLVPPLYLFQMTTGESHSIKARLIDKEAPTLILAILAKWHRAVYESFF